MTGNGYAATLLRHELKKARVPDSIGSNQLLDGGLLCIYKVAICDGKCRGGDHIIESLVGRGFNLASSSMMLCAIGYYDEALNLLRSLGELTNSLAYLACHPDEYRKWVLATRKERQQKFAPAAIRRGIGKVGAFEPPMDDATYSALSELATHATSSTKPNAYGGDNSRHVAGHRQKEGEAKIVNQLTYLVSQLAMLSTRMTARDDLFYDFMIANNLAPRDAEPRSVSDCEPGR